ncbi:flagellin [Pseudomonas nitritireducens]|uniref:Flagellin n=1 Tax=Pseudomonas nitroreducens TaxID=46680 RepID=A0A7W7P3B9_PSENT|nr:flagellin [Pseudomonas nitritireducens]MBB4865415.1 flagellin [Pseudomonas nitritireducens]
MSVINTNMSSLIAQRNLNNSSSAQSTAMERLSSGLRINSAKDDAAGQAISNRMTAQVRGMAQASRNANDGVSLAQTMEGGLQRINDNLQRMRELSVQAASDTNTAADRTSIQNEIDERALEITRIAENTSFNGTNLLNTVASLAIQVGAGTSADNQITLDTVKVDATTLAVNALDVSTAAGAKASITSLDAAIDTVNSTTSDLGAKLNRFDSVIANLSTSETNLTAARSRIQDADYAVEVGNMTRAQILQQAGTSVLSQANQSTQNVLKLLQ